MPDEDGKKVDTKNDNKDEKIWNNEFDFWIFHVKIRLYDNFHENLTRKNLTPFFETFFTSRGKNESKNEKYWEYESDLWIFHIKIWLYRNFHENLWKKFLTNFLGHFRPVEAKMKRKKCGKMSSIFEFSISKLDYERVFMKMCEKNFWPIF